MSGLCGAAGPPVRLSDCRKHAGIKKYAIFPPVRNLPKTYLLFRQHHYIFCICCQNSAAGVFNAVLKTRSTGMKSNYAFWI
jgi:hypothetical protein